jgi:hypothetical protein
MTQKQLIQAVRALGLVCRVTDGEYRISFPVSQAVTADRAEASAYYTDDRQDALNTAQAMARAYQPTVTR